MRKLVALAALGLAILSMSCDTKNVGGPLPTFGPKISSFTVTPADPAGLFGNENATFNVVFANGTAPYTISIDFGGAATPNVVDVPATSPFSTTVTLIPISAAAGQDFTATARVKDSKGITGQAATLNFHVGQTRNAAPTIDAITVNGTNVTVTVSDVDGDDLTVTLDSATGGLAGAPASQAVAGGSGTTGNFGFSATDVVAGATGTATFSVSDGKGGTDTDTSGTITVAPLVLAADALGAIPLTTSATTADTVKVLVMTGALAHAFQFMTGVSIVFPTGCGYDANSYDYGAQAAGDTALNPSAAKDQETVDGIWSTVNPTSGFLGVGDNLLVPDTALPAPFTGSSAIDFNITPLGGSDAPAGTSGILFNFNLKFTAAGSYKLDFLLFDEVNRTYYQDGSQATFQWTDITNTNSQNTVNVS